jgi:hypothetical protein
MGVLSMPVWWQQKRSSVRAYFVSSQVYLCGGREKSPMFLWGQRTGKAKDHTVDREKDDNGPHDSDHCEACNVGCCSHYIGVDPVFAG